MFSNFCHVLSIYRMKHLYIIGNGFDLFTGLHTSYSDFKRWLEVNNIFVYENMLAAYNMDGEWWNDFETQLGMLDVEEYTRRFTPLEKSSTEILADLKEREQKGEDQRQKGDGVPNLYANTPCANRLRGLLDILQFCFERWVDDCQKSINNPIYADIERDDSYFINFNYTDVLEGLYKIPGNRVLHLHGRASKHERLIIGHNSHPYGDMHASKDIEKTCLELSRYEKNPYEFINKHADLPEILSMVEEIHVYGFSISPIDEDYLDWIERNVPQCRKWEFNWYSDKDKERIVKFVLDHWRIKDKYQLMQLHQI